MKRSGFLKRLFFGGLGLTGVPALAEKLITEEKLKHEPKSPADVNTRGVDKKLSRPYIIKIENKSGSDVPSVLFMGALAAAPFNNYDKDGSITVNSVRITAEPVKYTHILHETILSPCYFGKMVIRSSLPVSSDKVLSVITHSYNGNSARCHMPVSQYRTPYDRDDKRIDIKCGFTIDGHTHLELTNLKKDEKLEIYLYPEVKLERPYSIYITTSSGAGGSDGDNFLILDKNKYKNKSTFAPAASKS